MASGIADRALDFGLDVFDTESTHISVCGAEPTTIGIAATSGLLGFKSLSAGGHFSAPSAGTTNGRRVTSNQITDGAITTTGTASWWAVYAAGTLHAHGTLAGAQAVTSGNTFTLAAFDITIPGA